MCGVMERRRFLAMGGALAAPGGGIVDTHTHFYDPSRPQGVPWPAKTDGLLYRTVMPGEFEAMVRPLGVMGTIVVEASPWLEDNQWVLDLAKGDPFLLGLVGHLTPGAAGFERDLERFRKNGLFLGIRLGGGAVREGLGQKKFIEDLRLMARHGLMLDVLGPAGMLRDVAKLASEVGGLRIVIDHMPFEPPPEEETLRGLEPLKNVWVKVSNVLRRREGALAADAKGLDVLWDVFGPRRLIYGSNWPVSEKVGPYGEVLRVVKDYFGRKGAEASGRFFHENSRAAYRWGERARAVED